MSNNNIKTSEKKISFQLFNLPDERKVSQQFCFWKNKLPNGKKKKILHSYSISQSLLIAFNKLFKQFVYNTAQLINELKSCLQLSKKYKKRIHQ